MEEIILKNQYLKVVLSKQGGTLLSIKFDDSEMILNYDDKQLYQENASCQGAIIGRTAGRIANGQFMLNQQNYQLEKNYLNKHNLHGNKLHLREYQFEQDDNKVSFFLEDCAQEYPGNLQIKIVYQLIENKLRCDIFGKADAETIINMTNHTYFNLNNKKSILDHHLEIPATKVYLLDPESIPQKLIDVKNTVFDFTKLKAIRKNYVPNEQFKITKFIDHPYQLPKNPGIITLYEPESNRKLEIATNQKYVVCYTGNYLESENFLFNQQKITDYQGICFEAQALPNAINIPEERASVIYNEDELYHNFIEYTFTK